MNKNWSEEKLISVPIIILIPITTLHFQVTAGQPLFVVIAMKMEYVVRSPRDGVVAGVSGARQGDAVGKGAEVVTLVPETESS